MKKPSIPPSDYADLYYLPHPTSKRHARMSMHNRAAQFSPFAALTGFEAVLEEQVRSTTAMKEMDESLKHLLDYRLEVLKSHLTEQPLFEAVVFIPDKQKDGGSYERITGRLQKLDTYHRTLQLTDGTVLSVDRILSLSGDLFEEEDRY